MRHTSSKAEKIALAGIGTSISLVAITIAFYFQMLSLSFYVMASGGILLPLTKEYYREAIIAYIAVCGIGAIYATIYILPFLLVTGAYTILAIFFHKKHVKIYIVIPIISVYASFVFFVLYQLTNLIMFDLEKFNLTSLSVPTIYVVANLVFILAFIAYHYCIIYAYTVLCSLMKKLPTNSKE
jgi:hypothetical protein